MMILTSVGWCTMLPKTGAASFLNSCQSNFKLRFAELGDGFVVYDSFLINMNFLADGVMFG